MNSYYVKITKENIDKLTKFLKDYSSEYEGYTSSWIPRINYYFEYPQYNAGTFSCFYTRPNIELTCEELLALKNQNILYMNIYNKNVVIKFNNFEEGLEIIKLMKQPHYFTKKTIKECLITYPQNPCVSLFNKSYANEQHWIKSIGNTIKIIDFKYLNKPKYIIYS